MVNRIISIDIYAQLGWSRSARQAVAEGSQLLAALRWRPSRSLGKDASGVGHRGGWAELRPTGIDT